MSFCVENVTRCDFGSGDASLKKNLKFKKCVSEEFKLYDVLVYPYWIHSQGAALKSDLSSVCV